MRTVGKTMLCMYSILLCFLDPTVHRRVWPTRRYQQCAALPLVDLRWKVRTLNFEPTCRACTGSDRAEAQEAHSSRTKQHWTQKTRLRKTSALQAIKRFVQMRMAKLAAAQQALIIGRPNTVPTYVLHRVLMR
jgi:hypothetical protein